MGTFDRLREELGFGYGPGDWFYLAESCLVSDDGTGFARKDGKRPAVLSQAIAGPSASVMVRTTTGEGFSHEPHSREVHEKCPVDRPGRIVAIPVLVHSDNINDMTWTCCEPDASALWAFLGVTRE